MYKVIVYGLGREYRKQEYYIFKEFIVVGLSDSNISLKEHYELFVNPWLISSMEWDYVYVTSKKYQEEIVKYLNETYKIPLDKIIGVQNTWWYVSNSNFYKRNDWIIEQLKTIKAGKRILDAGAGNQRYRPYCNHLDYVSQDFGKYDKVEKVEGIHGEDEWESEQCDILSDITDIPVEDESFDVILCSEVIEHLKNPILAIDEFYRILKKNGELILTAPFCSLTHMAPFYYSNGFSKYWYQDILSDAGFYVSSIIHNGNYFSYLAQELMRTEKMAIRYGTTALSAKEKELIMETTKIVMERAESTKGSEECQCFGLFVKAIKK